MLCGSFVVAVLATVVLALPAVVLADGRVALVVGNSTYAHAHIGPNHGQRRLALSAFLPKHAATFKADTFAPVCESYFDDQDREVRFTVPYESAEQDRGA